MTLTRGEEAIAAEYRQLLRIGLPKGVVIQRMMAAKVPHAIQQSVLNEENSTPSPIPEDESGRESRTTEFTEEVIDDVKFDPSQPLGGPEKSTTSFYEEIVIDDDESEYEEEIVEDESVDGRQLNAGENVPTHVYDKSISDGDVEYQYRPTKMPEETQPSPSSCWYWIVCLVFIGLLGGSAGVGYWLTTRDGDKVSSLESPIYTNPPTPAPSVAVSTRFDPIQGDCNFDVNDSNPNPIDQCNCLGEISIIESDIRERYFYNLEAFIPAYFREYDDDISSCSPRNQALVWISSGDDTELSTDQRAEKFALAAVFASLGGTQWKKSRNWLSYKSVCTWFGVKCDQGQPDYVTQLVLDDNNLIGVLPSELSLLARLQFLMVAQNKISGPIPVPLFTIKDLGTVDVSFNAITGVIPPTVGDAVSLNSLNVENNSMSGRLTRNIGRAGNLGYLNLRSNGFASELPLELFNLRRLRELDIADNKFTGVIPAEVSNLNALTKLTLGPNLFSGTIPSSIGFLGSLKYLSISGVADLSGLIPAEFGFYLSSLEEITISGTDISGNIDTSFGRLPSLKSIDFSGNQLRSTIPSELGSLGTLAYLDLGGNFLDGSIPETIGNLLALEELRLNDNLLQGGIPVPIGNLISLKTMRLEANRFEDRVADSICDLRQESLNVFVVDCPIEIEGTEMFGVFCQIPDCCTQCVPQ
ncbi:unnamed protein product [Pseudo-nitzschia multistriata]|uniref:Leucine-rich repeat-containing N-terminal plant-type domain-containing protein n=1 Tax=Pseudo-nitzschia multistriata TaxID=183589 RepID=A0A448ZH46_9STRA|nr:unnamed protein product [Pseudo-nitzschia multistriata]